MVKSKQRTAVQAHSDVDVECDGTARARPACRVASQARFMTANYGVSVTVCPLSLASCIDGLRGGF